MHMPQASCRPPAQVPRLTLGMTAGGYRPRERDPARDFVEAFLEDPPAFAPPRFADFADAPRFAEDEADFLEEDFFDADTFDPLFFEADFFDPLDADFLDADFLDADFVEPDFVDDDFVDADFFEPELFFDPPFVPALRFALERFFEALARATNFENRLFPP